MKLPLVNCPNCNSFQRFPPKTRTLDDGFEQSYINCKMCRVEIILNMGRPTKTRRHRTSRSSTHVR